MEEPAKPSEKGASGPKDGEFPLRYLLIYTDSSILEAARSAHLAAWVKDNPESSYLHGFEKLSIVLFQMVNFSNICYFFL